MCLNLESALLINTFFPEFGVSTSQMVRAGSITDVGYSVPVAMQRGGVLCAMPSHQGDSPKLLVTLGLLGKFSLLGNQGVGRG